MMICTTDTSKVYVYRKKGNIKVRMYNAYVFYKTYIYNIGFMKN